jgi:8-oxo-dGTP diphosphatase
LGVDVSVQFSAACAVIFDEEDRALLVRENYAGHRFGLPGGQVEPGESPEEAAVREVFEETGLRVLVEDLVGLYRFLEPPSFTGYAFRCTIVDGDPAVPASGEIAEIGWYPPTDLPTPLTRLVRLALEDARAGLSGVVRTIPDSSR